MLLRSESVFRFASTEHCQAQNQVAMFCIIATAETPYCEEQTFRHLFAQFFFQQSGIKSNIKVTKKKTRKETSHIQ